MLVCEPRIKPIKMSYCQSVVVQIHRKKCQLSTEKFSSKNSLYTNILYLVV